MKSTRLPGKALLEINGKPVLEYLIERLKSAEKPDMLAVCTTLNSEDEILESVASRNGAGFFRGSEHDILERYLGAATSFGVDFIVNADGDDIFCDPAYVDRVIETYRATGADYTTCEGLPFGAAPTGIKVEALREICRLKDDSDTETGWGAYFTRSGLFRVKIIKADTEVNRPEIRMTLDYPEDLQFFQRIIERLYKPGEIFSLKDIIRLLDNEPSIIDINIHRQEEYWANFNKKATAVKLRK